MDRGRLPTTGKMTNPTPREHKERQNQHTQPFVLIIKSIQLKTTTVIRRTFFGLYSLSFLAILSTKSQNLAFFFFFL